MRGKTIITLFILALSIVGCQKKNLDNNIGLEFDVLNVNFGGDLADRSWKEGDEIGIYSSCTRNEQQNIGMSSNENAKYRARIAGSEIYFTNVSDGDQIIATAADHNFKFYAYFPYSNTNTGISAVGVQVPMKQLHAVGVENYGLYVANEQVTTVVPTVDLDFKGVFSIIELYLPNDIIEEDGNSVVRSLTLKAAVAENFDGVLADGGTYNLETGVFTSNPDMRAEEVELDFGTSGLLLTDAFTKVSLAVAPFTVPVGGLDVVVTDLSGNETSLTIWGEESDEGTVLAAGEVLTQYLSRDNDGIIPVNFPVVFPLGIVSGVQSNNATTQPRWVVEGIWTSSQPQAYAEWHKVSNHESDAAGRTYQLALTNSGAISTPEIRGIWTGDYLEFLLPVKRFAAGTAVTMKAPLYTRQGPIFWNIQYFDEGEWKSNTQNLTTDFTTMNPGATESTYESTLFLRYDDIGRVIEHTMVFTDAIQSGYVKIRLTCAEGSKQADGNTANSAGTRTAATRTTPWTNAGNYAAPTYFRSVAGNEDSYAVTFSIN